MKAVFPYAKLSNHFKHNRFIGLCGHIFWILNSPIIPGQGARFSKLPVIIGPVKQFCFSF